MKKFELIEAINQKTQIDKKAIERILETFEEITIETIKNGGEVVLTGFGTFSAKQRKGREGVNPRNPSEKITIPSVLVPKFKAGKVLKDTLKS